MRSCARPFPWLLGRPCVPMSTTLSTPMCSISIVSCLLSRTVKPDSFGSCWRAFAKALHQYDILDSHTIDWCRKHETLNRNETFRNSCLQPLSMDTTSEERQRRPSVHTTAASSTAFSSHGHPPVFTHKLQLSADFLSHPRSLMLPSSAIDAHGFLRRQIPARIYFRGRPTACISQAILLPTSGLQPALASDCLACRPLQDPSS